MLVLSRKMGEQIVLSRDGVEIGRVLVVEVDRYRCRIAFEGFNGITIDRLELHQAKERGHAECEEKDVCPVCKGPRGKCSCD